MTARLLKHILKGMAEETTVEITPVTDDRKIVPVDSQDYSKGDSEGAAEQERLRALQRQVLERAVVLLESDESAVLRYPENAYSLNQKSPLPDAAYGDASPQVQYIALSSGRRGCKDEVVVGLAYNPGHSNNRSFGYRVIRAMQNREDSEYELVITRFRQEILDRGQKAGYFWRIVGADKDPRATGTLARKGRVGPYRQSMSAAKGDWGFVDQWNAGVLPLSSMENYANEYATEAMTGEDYEELLAVMQKGKVDPARMRTIAQAENDFSGAKSMPKNNLPELSLRARLRSIASRGRGQSGPAALHD